MTAPDARLAATTAAVVVVTDLATKHWWAPAELNEGLVLGLGGASTPGWWWAAAAAVALLGLLARPAWAAGLFLGGCAGNIADHVTLGGVRDWAPIPATSAITNVADVAILVGAAAAVFSTTGREVAHEGASVQGGSDRCDDRRAVPPVHPEGLTVGPVGAAPRRPLPTDPTKGAPTVKALWNRCRRCRFARAHNHGLCLGCAWEAQQAKQRP